MQSWGFDFEGTGPKNPFIMKKFKNMHESGEGSIMNERPVLPAAAATDIRPISSHLCVPLPSLLTELF